MNNSKICEDKDWKNDIKCDNYSKPRYDSIIALKIFDQCLSKECIDLRPVLSGEKCICIILQSDDDPFGRVILPGKPLYMPDLVSKVKIISNSFITKKIQITKISPSKVKPGYWDIEVQFTFIFKIQLLDSDMKVLDILFCRPDCEALSECKDIRNYITGMVDYVKKATLFGSTPESTLMASDLLPQEEPPIENKPHVMVDAKAYFIDISLKNPDEVLFFEEVMDDIYDEPTIYVYITIGLFMVIKLFRLASILIESMGYSIPGHHCSHIQNECDLLSEMVFPSDYFCPEAGELMGKE